MAAVNLKVFAASVLPGREDDSHSTLDRIVKADQVVAAVFLHDDFIAILRDGGAKLPEGQVILSGNELILNREVGISVNL